MAALERELSDVRALCADRLETIQRLENERDSLHEQIHELQLTRTQVEESVLMQQPLVCSAQDRIVALEAELQTLRAQVDTQRKELAEVHEMRKLAESRRSEQEMNHIKKTLQSKLDALEFDVKRYHAERDEYRHKWEALHRTTQQMSTPTQLQSLITSLQSQREKLKDENAALKKELSQLKVELAQYTLKSERSLQDALDAKTLECQELSERLTRQQKVISDLQQRLHAIAPAVVGTSVGHSQSSSPPSSSPGHRSDLKSDRETSSLAADNDANTNNAKNTNNSDADSNETPTQLKLQELQMKLIRLERLNRELQKKIEAQKKEGEALISEIETISKEFETVQSLNIRLAQQLTEKEDTNLQLVSERVKANHTQQTLSKERELLNNKIAELRAQNQHTTELLEAQTRKIAILEEQIKKLTEELKVAGSLTDQHRATALSLTLACNELRNKVQHVERLNNQLKEVLKQQNVSLGKERSRSDRLSEENLTLKRQLEHYTKIESNTSLDQSVQRELNYYKQLVRCSQCNEREKDVVIARCFHTFCKQCVQENLRVRNRKCPRCGKAFGESDVHALFM